MSRPFFCLRSTPTRKTRSVRRFLVSISAFKCRRSVPLLCSDCFLVAKAIVPQALQNAKRKVPAPAVELEWWSGRVPRPLRQVLKRGAAGKGLPDLPEWGIRKGGQGTERPIGGFQTARKGLRALPSSAVRRLRPGTAALRGHGECLRLREFGNSKAAAKGLAALPSTGGVSTGGGVAQVMLSPGMFMEVSVREKTREVKLGGSR